MKRARIEALLPAVFRRATDRSPALAGLIDAMEALHAPAEDVLSDVELHWDPWRSPLAFLPYLATWVGLGYVVSAVLGGQPSELDPADPRAGRLRALIAEAARLDKLRGTPQGLARMLELATGCAGFRVRVTPERAFHMQVHVPEGARSEHALVRLVTASERPVNMTFELVEGEECAP